MSSSSPLSGMWILVALVNASIFISFMNVAVGQDGFDNERLEAIEERTEELANRLLEFSVQVRRGDLDGAGEFLSPSLNATPWPKPHVDTKSMASLVDSRSFDVPSEQMGLSREDYLKSLENLMSHFDRLEDVRFKVKYSQIADDLSGASGVLKFFFIGRNLDGQREWVKGVADFSAGRQEDGIWALDRFSLTDIKSKVATTEIFSEVTVPAEVSAELPPFFQQSSPGYVWRGAAVADVDGDGLVDVFISSYERNSLYINRGDGRFEDRASDANLEFFPREGLQPLFLDIDNDGDQDLFVTSIGQQMLFENTLVPEGELTFLDVSHKMKAHQGIGFSAVTADVNKDGYQDIYVCSYNRYGIVMPDDWKNAVNGTPNLLLMNKGDGTFEDEAKAFGVDDSRWSYAAQFADVDQDGDQDLFVANDYGVKALYINKGDHFEDEAIARGVLDPGNGMGVSFGDFDCDGDLDLHVTNMSSTAGNRILARLYPDATRQANVLKKLASGNSMFENQGDGTFVDVTEKAGGMSAGWAWGGGFVDIDNDGLLDVFTPNGFVSGKSMADT